MYMQQGEGQTPPRIPCLDCVADGNERIHHLLQAVSTTIMDSHAVRQRSWRDRGGPAQGRRARAGREVGRPFCNRQQGVIAQTATPCCVQGGCARHTWRDRRCAPMITKRLMEEQVSCVLGVCTPPRRPSAAQGITMQSEGQWQRRRGRHLEHAVSFFFALWIGA